MDNNKQAIDQLIQGINKMVVDYCKKYSTMIYDGIVISNNFDGRWNVRYNGEVHAMKPYKTSPTVGEMVKVFIPNGNQNLGFILSSVSGGGGGGGENGATFYPSVSEDGTLSWTNDKGLPNPPSVNIKGPAGQNGADATINGVNTLEIVEGENITLSQSGNTLTISSTGGGTGSTVSVNVGTTTTGEAGTNAQVTNSGTPQNVVLNFTIPRGADGLNGQNGTDGEDGATFIPSVSAEGVLSWTNNGNLPNPDPVNIKGPQGEQGPQGIPGANGTDGQDATINGQNVINIVAGENIVISQEGNTLIISSTGGTGGGGMSAEIIVTPYDTFTSVTATSQTGVVYNGNFANDVWTIKVNEFGEYTVNGYGDTPDSTTVTVLVCQQYQAILGTPPATPVLNENSWETIRAVSDSSLGENYWSVGDAKQIDLSGKTIGTVTYVDFMPWVYILGFNHNAGIEGNNRIHFGCFRSEQEYSTTNGIALIDSYYGSQTSVELAYHMNTTNTNVGGWESCIMRTGVLNSNASSATAGSTNSFLSALPSDLQAVMKQCTKYSDNVGGGSDQPSDVTATQDWIWLLSEFEVSGRISFSNNAERDYQQQYQYYIDGNTKIKYRHSNVSSASAWNNRSISASGATGFCILATTAALTNAAASNSYGLVPAFCV